VSETLAVTLAQAGDVAFGVVSQLCESVACVPIRSAIRTLYYKFRVYPSGDLFQPVQQ